MVHNRNPITMKSDLQAGKQDPLKETIKKLQQQITEKNQIIGSLTKQKQDLTTQQKVLETKFKQQESSFLKEKTRLTVELAKKNVTNDQLKKANEAGTQTQLKLQKEIQTLKKQIEKDQKAKLLQQTQHEAVQKKSQARESTLQTTLETSRAYYEDLVENLLQENQLLQEKLENPLKLVLLNAAASGAVKEVEAALVANVDLEIENEKGDTPLAIALQHGHDTLAVDLFDAGASVEHKDKNNKSILEYLAEESNLKMLEYVLVADQYKETPINPNLLRAALAVAPNAKAQSMLAQSLFPQAAKLGDIALADLALSYQINQDQQDEKYKNTALHLAAANQQAEMVKYLLEKCCSVNIRDKEGRSAAELSTEPSIVEAFKLHQAKNAQATKIQAVYRGFFTRQQNPLGELKKELHERLDKLLPDLKAQKDYITMSHLESAFEEKRYMDLKGMLDRLDEIAKAESEPSTTAKPN